MVPVVESLMNKWSYTRHTTLEVNLPSYCWEGTGVSFSRILKAKNSLLAPHVLGELRLSSEPSWGISNQIPP